MDFPETIKAKYRVVETRYGDGDGETTIPLGSWRKGGGLAGSKGHVYLYGSGWAGVWLTGRASKVAYLRLTFPAIQAMQFGNGEATFRVPMADLDRLLPLIQAKRVKRLSSAAKVALNEAGKSSRFQTSTKARG